MDDDINTERVQILKGDARDRLQDLPANSVHTCITSPPYWGLRDYDADGQIGLEERPGAFVEALVETFREVRRVLRPDGTLWLNLGDCYANTGGAKTDHDGQLDEDADAYGKWQRDYEELKPKDLVGMPWRVAFALQQDGWWLRSDIVWAKGISGDERMGQCMPESVTDRPISAHETVFLLTPSKHYYYDHIAVREPLNCPDASVPVGGANKRDGYDRDTYSGNAHDPTAIGGGNLRDVLHTNPGSFEDAHFAVYPPNLIQPFIRAGTSEKGCCVECGAPWERITERENEIEDAGRSEDAQYQENKDSVKGRSHDAHRRLGQQYQDAMEENPLRTVGWEPTCDCDTAQTKPCTVLDPFLGSGTTALVALEEGRDAIGIELNPDYIDLSQDRLGTKAHQARMDEDW